jgi:ferritin-like metal-binding protein YciE
MAEKTLRNLFVNELRDIYDAENQIIKALPKMAEYAHSDELRKAFKDHVEQTKTHIKRVEDIFGELKEKRESRPCTAIKGIFSENEEMMREFSKSPALDAALIASAQKVEHYEMASYGSLRDYAKWLNIDGALEKLQNTLNEEGEENSLLAQLATRRIYNEARA